MRRRSYREDCPRRTRISFKIGTEAIDINKCRIFSFVGLIKINLSHVDVVGLSILAIFLCDNLSSFAVEKVLDDFISGLNSVFRMGGKEVE